MSDGSLVYTDAMSGSLRGNHGFTLIEMLLVVSVMAILTIIALRNIATVRVATALNEATKTIIDTVEEARHFSASGKELASGVFPSYGVAFDMSSIRDITVFADCKLDDTNNGLINVEDDFTYVPTSTDCASGSGSALVEEVRITLNPRVVIRDIRTVSDVPETQAKASVVYMRPDPTTWVTEGDGTVLPYGRLEVVIGDTGGDREKIVRFWTSGLIDVQ
jgi:prepilin-type N-terminal cleavage/methylation domain-containing protein